MKAVVIHAAKDLRIEQRNEEPVGPGQVAIAVEAGGICGSDLHYYNHGGFGTVRIREPMILGHEVAGTVKALGEGVSNFAVGDRVAVSPSRPCSHCEYCLRGEQNHCLEHAILRQRDAHAAYSGGVPAKARRGAVAVPQGSARTSPLTKRPWLSHSL